MSHLFEVDAYEGPGQHLRIKVACRRCGWSIWVDQRSAFADLVDGVDQHAEVCARSIPGGIS